MPDRKPRRWPLAKRAKGAFIRLMQTRVLKMDIHPTAVVDPTALIDRTWPKGIHIGERCRIEANVMILTHDLTRGVYLDTRIGARSWLGERAMILPGLTIGEDCVVMPGSLVTKDMPAGSIAAGNPARITAPARQGRQA